MMPVTFFIVELVLTLALETFNMDPSLETHDTSHAVV